MIRKHASIRDQAVKRGFTLWVKVNPDTNQPILWLTHPKSIISYWLSSTETHRALSFAYMPSPPTKWIIDHFDELLAYLNSDDWKMKAS